MDESHYFFCNLGIMPDRLPPPPERVRATIGRGSSASQWAGVGCFGILFVGMAIPLAIFPPLYIRIVVPVALVLLFVALMLLVFRSSHQWVELDGRTLRAKHFLSRRVVEHSVDDIKEIFTLVNISALPAVSDLLTGGRVRGFEIRFAGAAAPIRVYRADPAMSNARELMEAIVARMAETRKIETEIINLEGTPLVQRLYFEPSAATT